MKQLLVCDYLTPDLYVEECKQRGLGIEFQSFYDPSFTFDSEQYKEWTKQLGYSSIHAPFFDLFPGSFDEEIRRVTKKRFEKAYEIAREIGSKHIVFHNSFFPQAHIRDGWLERATDSWTDFLGDKDDSILCHIENTLEFDPELIIELLDTVNDPRLSAILDIGHAHAFSKQPVLYWVKTLGERIGYVHLHNNHGETDDHTALDDGTAPMQEICLALEDYAPNAVWALETRGYEPVTSSLKWLEQNDFIDLTNGTAHQ